MQSEESVFGRTYRNYLEQLKGLSFASIAPKLGAKIDGDVIRIPLFNSEYRVSVEKITGPSGEKPPHDICVLLGKYLLLCPDEPSENNDWVSFRDFKDSAPLLGYFANEVERPIARYFAQKIDALRKASGILGGYPPSLDVQYDLAVRFDALPMIPIMMLFNDMNEEFSAQCSVLFESSAEKYLDAECLAMLGWQLFFRLRKVLK
jgi:hypothetical protein